MNIWHAPLVGEELVCFHMRQKNLNCGQVAEAAGGNLGKIEILRGGYLGDHKQCSTWNLVKNALLPKQSHLSMCKMLFLDQFSTRNPNLIMSQCQN